MTYINNHKLKHAAQYPSPNHGGRITPKFIVMHYTAGWTADGAIDTFTNDSSQVSAQLTIGTGGEVYQHVPFNVRAWHAGPSSFAGYSGLNGHSVGIEFVNPGYLRKLDDGRFMDAYENVHSARQVGPVVRARHSRVGSGTFYWPAYTQAQIDAGLQITESLIAAYPIIDIVSHEEIDNRGWKTDPGPAFPMNRFKALLGDRGNDVIHYEVTASSLRMRGGPGTNFDVLGAARRGDRVVRLDQRGDWVRINEDAWVHGAYLRRMT